MLETAGPIERIFKIAAIFIGVLVALTVLLWIAGVRIFVVQPIGAIPKGVTVIVFGVRDLHFIDSPDAFCQRKSGGVSMFCRGLTAGRVAKEGTILLRLPFSRALYTLSDAPKLDR